MVLHWKRILPLIFMALLVSASSAEAQPDKPWKWVFGHVYAGPAWPQGDAADGLEQGWSFGGGATLRKENWPVAFTADLAYNNLRIQQDKLWGTDEQDDPVKIADSGSFDVWSITGDLLWQPKTKGNVGFYLQGGVGFYYSSGKLTNSVWVPGWGCGWVWCVPGYWPGQEIVGSESSWDWGSNAGAGIPFALASDSQIFVQATWHSVQNEYFTIDYLPVVVGYRW
jgi:hypothetical protein